MQLGQLLDELGYRDSPNFLLAGTEAFRRAPYYGHILRRAAEKPCRLRGAYTLRAPSTEAATPAVPIVYVCDASSEALADEIHRRVWNQDIVPFLIVKTRHAIRLYSGFRFRRSPTGEDLGFLSKFNDVLELAEAFHADSIDQGRLWRQWGDRLTPEDRVDWRLLENLSQLDIWLQKEGGLQRDVSHALIGKYVYLHYLRDRKILSPRKLQGWGIQESAVFGRNATLAGLQAVVDRLDRWLNGSVFPLDLSGRGSPNTEHVQRVAGTFNGDEIVGDRSWQLHLEFQAYDFSYLPIETLSVVYEQFLHSPDKEGKSKGREAGAYYTPIPVVNLMLSELEDRRPLQEGTRVLDPSCGSGAFLVQSYRRLIEKKFPVGGRAVPRPVQLRDLLEKHIFGVDRDPDACSVAELSLILTLLDYVDPPDLENGSRFKLPALRDKNIFCADFFDKDSAWRDILLRTKCHWIVGNPPWKKLNPRRLKPDERLAWDWMRDNRRNFPVGGNQLAQAFAWEVSHYLAADGQIGMLLPAMTLFEDPSTDFRAAFLQQKQVSAIANFANLAEVLFAGRSRVPAAAFFFRPGPVSDVERSEDAAIAIYSPLVANQEPTRPISEGKRNETWSLTINASEVRRVSLGQVADGSGLPWKIAMWGSHLDRRLLDRLARRFQSLDELEHHRVLFVSQGLELRGQSKDPDDEEVEFCEEVIGKPILNVTPLKRMRNLFCFPGEATEGRVERNRAYVRKGRSELPLRVCRPPHILVSAARNFAVLSDEYLIVPPRQIGIVSPSGDEAFLRALCVYLNSDFAFYHQFLTSTQFGVQRGLATLRALRQMPVPLLELTPQQLEQWAALHSRLVEASTLAMAAAAAAETPLFAASVGGPRIEDLMVELNDRVSDCLRLDRRSRALVHDLVRVRLELNDGKLGARAVRPPTVDEMRSYAKRLKADLDAFIGDELPKRHEVAVVHDALSGMIQVDLIRDRDAARKLVMMRADDAGAAQLNRVRRRLRAERSQWVYFNRNLRIYEGTRTFVFKPMQRFHWTESQAMFDAAEIIAETLAGSGGPP